MKNKNKDKKIHESWIGKIIYGFLMFIPLLTILFTTLYTTFNKNAYQSYYGETINESKLIELQNNNELIQGKTYYYTNTRLNNTEYTGTITAANIKYISSNTTITAEQKNFIENAIKIYFFKGTSTTFYDTNENSQNINPNGLTIKLTFTGTTSTNAYHALYKYEFNKYSYLDNAFEYGIYKTSNSPLFNWTKSSIIYNGLSATTQSLNIETEFIPMLLTYWLIISLLYMLYDIVLVIFHVLHKKIHNLEESI